MTTNDERLTQAILEIEHLKMYMTNLSEQNECCNVVLTDKRFAIAPASSGWHQAYPGGLAIHTYEVVTTARRMNTYNDKFGLTVLTIAGIFHDYHKIYEYAFNADGSIEKLPYRKRIGHVVGSWHEFMKCAEKTKMRSVLRDEISHCMLAHHGRLEWRSPVEPQTSLAHILHAADMISTQGEFKA